MTTRTVTEVAIKVWGVILTASALNSLFLLAVIELSNSADERFSIPAFAGAGIKAALGILLILKARAVAGRLFPEESPVAIAASASELLSVALKVLGMYSLVMAVQHGALVGYEAFAKPKWDEVSMGQYLWDKRMESVVRFAAAFFAGIALLVAATPVSKVWSRLRRLSGENLSEPSST